MPTIGPIVEEMALNPSVYSFELLTFKESPVNESAASNAFKEGTSFHSSLLQVLVIINLLPKSR